MRLDQVRLAGRGARGLDHVGIDRALREPAHVFELRGLALEHLDEHAADDLALLLRVRDAVEGGEELRFRVDSDHVRAEVLPEHGHHVVALVEAQEARVDEHADELVADRRVQQRRDDRRVDAAREPEQHAILADLRAHVVEVLGDDVLRSPARLAAADLEHEAADDL